MEDVVSPSVCGVSGCLDFFDKDNLVNIMISVNLGLCINLFLALINAT